MKLDSKEELLTDFNKMINSIDFKNYNPSSPDFMSALFIGLMWQLLSDIPVTENDEDETEENDIAEELNDSEKYLQMYMNTSDIQFKQMAIDELRHAKILINREKTKELSEEEAAEIEKYDERRNELATRLV